MKNLLNIILISGLLIFSFSCRDAISDSNEVKPPESTPFEGIVIFKPALCEILNPGDGYKIEWIKGSIKHINIILLKKKQYHRLVIRENSLNTGSVNWLVPGNIPLSTTYQIKIENSENTSQFFYSEVFEVSNRQ